MERGEVWLAEVYGVQPVVLLSAGAELLAMQIVEPATEEQKRGFRFVDPGAVPEDGPGAVSENDPGAAPEDDRDGGEPRVISGIEVPIGPGEGLVPAGVVRVALPFEGRVFCTWQVSLTPGHLIERLGALDSGKLRRLGEALRLAGVE